MGSLTCSAARLAAPCPRFGAPQQLQRLTPPATTPLRLQARCSRRRQRRTETAASISAAQKKVFTSFEDMINQSSEPVLVEFYATWCGPCQMMGKILEEVAPSLRDRVRFVKVESERYPSLASRYHVTALPTLILFKNGQPVDRVEGVLLAPDLRSRLDYMLAR